MQRYALAPIGSTQEQVLVAIPRRGRDWTIAQRNRGSHRLLVPVDASLQAKDALRYIVEHLGDHVAHVHLVNVQREIMSGNVTPLVTASTITEMRRAAGEGILSIAAEALASSGISVTSEVAFGAAAETICRVAQERGCTGIVIARNGFELHDLIGGSVAAKVLRLAGVPVTIVNARTAVTVAHGEPRHARAAAGDMATLARPAHDVEPAGA
jgi:nucleotide-binding universal stress UspA family protein